jgi:hypothetical protein
MTRNHYDEQNWFWFILGRSWLPWAVCLRISCGSYTCAKSIDAFTSVSVRMAAFGRSSLDWCSVLPRQITFVAKTK